MYAILGSKLFRTWTYCAVRRRRQRERARRCSGSGDGVDGSSSGSKNGPYRGRFKKQRRRIVPKRYDTGQRRTTQPRWSRCLRYTVRTSQHPPTALTNFLTHTEPQLTTAQTPSPPRPIPRRTCVPPSRAGSKGARGGGGRTPGEASQRVTHPHD